MDSNRIHLGKRQSRLDHLVYTFIIQLPKIL